MDGGGAYMKGVYMFKQAFGPDEMEYRYYVNYYKDLELLKKLAIETILNEYKWFYVLPFSDL